MRKRDLAAGITVIAFGAAAILGASDYGFGTLRLIGPAFFPTVLGALMVGVGLVISQRALFAAVEPEVVDPLEPLHGSGPDLRGCACILLGAIAFLILGKYGGLVPATFASVAIAAVGDRNNGIVSALGLAAGVTIFGVLVFHFGLQVQLPMFRWGYG